MSIDISQYQFDGDELLDLLDSLESLNDQARFELAIYNETRRDGRENIPARHIDRPNSLNYTIESLKDVHSSLDDLFEQEYTKFRINTVEKREDGGMSVATRDIESNANSLEEMARFLEEIEEDLSDRTVGMDYSDVPSTIAAVDYSEKLVGEYQRLEGTYKLVGLK